MHFKRTISLAMAVFMMFSIINPLSAFAIDKAGCSSSYKSGPYYQNLCNVKITGNQREDIVNIALSQEGYMESNSTSDLAGTTSGSGDGTEYGRYTGAAGQAWCASFVSWCAYQAGVSTSVIPKTASSKALAISESNWTTFSADTASKIKAGDVVHVYNPGGHSGIVYKVDNNYIYTIEGNVSRKVKCYQYRKSDGGCTVYGARIDRFYAPKYVNKHNELIGGVNVSLSRSSFTYNGYEKRPLVTVVSNTGKTLVEGKDYIVSYGNNRYPGQGVAIVEAIGRYKGTVLKYFYVDAGSLKKLTAELTGYRSISVSWEPVKYATGYYVYRRTSEQSSYSYLGKTTKTTINNSKLESGKRYIYKVVPYIHAGDNNYECNGKSVGIYTLKKLKTPSVSKYSKTKVAVKFENIKGASGFQISKTTSLSNRHVALTAQSKTAYSRALTVKRNTKYYYRVRAYKVVDGKKIYGPWSLARSYKLN